MVNLGCALMAECCVKATSAHVPEIQESERLEADGEQANAVTIGGGLVFQHPDWEKILW